MRVRIKDGQTLPWLGAIQENYGEMELTIFRELKAGDYTEVPDETGAALVAAGICEEEVIELKKIIHQEEIKENGDLRSE